MNGNLMSADQSRSAAGRSNMPPPARHSPDARRPIQTNTVVASQHVIPSVTPSQEIQNKIREAQLARKQTALEGLSRNYNWVASRPVDSQGGRGTTQKEKEKASQNRIFLHFNVWRQNLAPFFRTPPIPPTLLKVPGMPRTALSMYVDAEAWADEMVHEIEDARARGEPPYFTDADFDRFIVTLGRTALLRRLDPEIRTSVGKRAIQS